MDAHANGTRRDPDTTLIVLMVLAVLAGATSAAGEILLRAGVVIVPASVAVIDSSLAWLFLTAAIVKAGLARAAQESPRMQRGIRRVVLGSIILYPSLALVTPVEQWFNRDVAFAIDAISTLIAMPLMIAGAVTLCWPARFSKSQLRVLVADSIVGLLGLAVLWLVAVIPMAGRTDDDGWGTANALFMLLLAGLLVVLVAASRRRAMIPARQVVLVHGAIAVHLLGGLLEILAPVSGAVTAVKVFHLFGVLGGLLLFMLFISPSGRAETASETRAREIYAALGPLLPIPLATFALVSMVARERGEPTTAEVLGGMLLVLVLLSVVVLRALASAELRGAARERADVQLSSSTEEEWFRVLMGRTTDLALVMLRDGTIAYGTPSLQRATGLTGWELRGRRFASLLSLGDQGDVLLEQMGLADRMAGEPTPPTDLLLRGADGSVREVEWQTTALVGLDIDGYLVNGRDVTDQRRMQALLAESVSRDTLTGLHSRSGFLAAVADRCAKGCILVINLRRFADYNDRFGHAAGDHMLRQVAQILRSLPGAVSDPARLSADTFAVLVGGAVPEIEVVSAAASARDAVRIVSLSDGRPVPLELAAGYAVSEHDQADPGELLGRAELAMMRSRSLDRSPLVRYDPSLRMAKQAAATAEADLRSALRERALVVRYQPIVRLTDGAVVAVEALVRRQRADGSLESPEVFIPLAERLGLVDEVDYAVLMRALGELRLVAESVGRRLPVSVNISATELDDGLEHRVLDALASTGWSAEHLVIEVTETALAARSDEASRLLRRLQRIGCSIAIDDFGTGYSSMASLLEMPVDILKIDASFTHRLTAAGRGLSLMRAIVEIGRSLNLVTVAEGLSTVEQADLLRGMGCERGQGFLYAPPLSVEELVDFLRPDPSMLEVD